MGRILEAEIADYVSMSAFANQEDPLACWKDNKVHLRQLSKVEVIYLGALASSIQSEQIFSTANQSHYCTVFTCMDFYL